MATFIRNHPTANATGAGSSIATALSAAVPAGRLLFAVTAGAAQDSSALSKPGGESANWVDIGSKATTTGDGLTRTYMRFWAIKTTVGWASGQTVTATFSGSGSARTLGIAEFSGATTTVVSTAEDSTNDRNARNITATTDPVMRAGDLVLQANLTQGAVNEVSSGGTATATRADLATSSNPGLRATAYLVNGPGSRTVTYGGGLVAKAALIVGLLAENYPPNAPTLTSMASGGTVNRANTNRARWSFSDDNPGDSQSKYDLQYQVDSSGTWTTVTSSTPNQFYDFASGIAAGDYEWQVRTYDAMGAVGPWSTSGFFTAADQPDGPTITYPTAGQSVEQLEHIDWSSPDQEKCQVRRVADDEGDPDPGTIYFDSGEVVDTDTRTLPLDFSVNDRIEHVQVRVYADGLWSEWVDVDVDVSYTPPPAPSYVLYPDPSDGSLLLLITNPAPGEDEPAAIYNRVLINDSAEGLRIDRNATSVSPNGTWRYRVPVSGYSYTPDRLIVEAVADNGTTSRSAT